MSATCTINNIKTQTDYIKYGFLYNCYVVMDVRNIANIGWHVQTYTEGQTLSTYLGGNSVSGGKMKEVGTTHWETPNTGATNSSGFTGRGSGSRTNTGVFIGIGQSNYCWHSVEESRTMYLYYNRASLGNAYYTRTNGFSIRLIKDSTTLSDGQSGTYIGNDGRFYRTICIGTQEWLADNLVETKYRNGDTIPEITDVGEWADLTTGALCAYNNNWANVFYY